MRKNRGKKSGRQKWQMFSLFLPYHFIFQQVQSVHGVREDGMRGESLARNPPFQFFITEQGPLSLFICHKFGRTFKTIFFDVSSL